MGMQYCLMLFFMCSHSQRSGKYTVWNRFDISIYMNGVPINTKGVIFSKTEISLRI